LFFTKIDGFLQRSMTKKGLFYWLI